MTPAIIQNAGSLKNSRTLRPMVEWCHGLDGLSSARVFLYSASCSSVSPYLHPANASSAASLSSMVESTMPNRDAMDSRSSAISSRISMFANWVGSVLNQSAMPRSFSVLTLRLFNVHPLTASPSAEDPRTSPRSDP